MKKIRLYIKFSNTINNELIVRHCIQSCISKEQLLNALQYHYIILCKQNSESFGPIMDNSGNITFFSAVDIENLIEHNEFKCPDIIMNALGWYKQTTRSKKYELKKTTNINLLRDFSERQMKMPFSNFVSSLKGKYVIISSLPWRGDTYLPATFNNYPIFYEKEEILTCIRNFDIKRSNIVMNAYEWYKLNHS